MSQATGHAARKHTRAPFGKIDHVMGVWFAALALAALFVGLSPPEEAAAAVNRSTPRVQAGITPAERHCMVQTAIGEATPGHKAEVIAIMRGMLKRRAMGSWGPTICHVAKAPRQYSTFNNRSMPKKPRKPSKMYRRYSQWADLAVMAGPSRFDHYVHPKTMVKLYGKKYPKWWRACKETRVVGAAKFCRIRS